MNNPPVLISILFVIITLLTVWQFYNASGKSKILIICISFWLLLQAIAGITGFYHATQSIPPRFILLIGPGFILSVVLLLTKSGRAFMDSLSIRKLTLLHSVRVGVEITLYFVYTAKLIPRLMTFEGNNFDIISGLTAPIIYYLVFVSKKLNSKALLVWNFVCLVLLVNVLIIAILSAQTPFQKLAFDQPNIGVTFFPFVWLPAVVVPIVLISHLSAIRQLMKEKNQVKPAVNNQSLSAA